MKQKTYVLKIIFSIFIINMFFVFAVSTSFAEKDTKIGSIDMSVENKVKVCKDVACAKPEIIDFRISDGYTIIIDKEKGISGKAWGGELGWITFSPRFLPRLGEAGGEAGNYPDGGVFFADPPRLASGEAGSKTGLLKGTAWSENSGAINFSVTGQKVVIDPKTGEWKGWAWASGPYGGWVKFDCKDKSCVHTIWSEKNEKETSSDIESTKTSSSNFFNAIKETVSEKSKIISNTFNIFITSSVDLFNKAGQITADTYNFLYSNLIDLRSSVLGEK